MRKLRAAAGTMLVCASACAEPPLEHMDVLLAATEYPPLMSEALPDGGLLVRIVSEAFGAANVGVKIAFVPNNRAIQGVMGDASAFDGSVGWAHSPERDKKLYYSALPIHVNREVFFYLLGNDYPWKKLADLSAPRIGATLGNYYSDEFAALRAQGVLHVDDAASDLSNLRKLLYGRIALFPMDEQVGQYVVRTGLKPAEQRRIGMQTNVLSSIPIYLVIRKSQRQSRQLLERFNLGFQRLSDSGRLAVLNSAANAQASAPR